MLAALTMGCGETCEDIRQEIDEEIARNPHPDDPGYLEVDEQPCGLKCEPSTDHPHYAGDCDRLRRCLGDC